MALYAELFDGTRLEFPDNTDPAVIDRVAREETAKRQPKGESGFLPAVKASTQSLLGEAALLGGKLGLYTPEEAQKKFEAREAEARRIFAPTESWSDGAFTKFKELLGGSIPYMAAPLAAAGAAAVAPLTGPAAVAAGLGAAGLTSAAQFTGSNLARQLETGKSLDEASFGAAAAAAAPQALLDVIAFRAVPLIRQLFTSVGKDITEEAAQNLAKQGITNTIKDYAVTTGKTAGVEGLTESGQSFLERLQAGLNIADPSARAEYLDSFIGGAVLGGTLAPVGRYIERQKQVEEPLAPGQRPGESLEQTAQRLNFDIKQMTAQPEKSPFLSSSELASMAAEENGYGKLVQYAERIKQEPDSPEKQASLEAAIELRKRVVSEAEARQTPTDKPYPFAEEPEKPIYLTGTGLIDLVNTKETPKDQLVSLLEYISKTKKDPESPERDQSVEQARTLYNLLQEEAKSRGFDLPEAFTLRATDLRAAGIPRTDPVYDQVKDKDLNNPDEADFVVKALEAAQKRATPDLYDKLEGVLDSIDRYLESRPGSGFYAQRTYPQPSGEGVAVAGRRAGEQSPAEGPAPSERGGVAPVTEPAEQPVPTEKVQPVALEDTGAVSVEPAYEPGMDARPEVITQLEDELRKAETERSALEKVRTPSLFQFLRGKIEFSDVKDITPLKAAKEQVYRFLIDKSGRGKPVSEFVNDGMLDVWLPPNMRHDSVSYDQQESTEYIKERLRRRDFVPYHVEAAIKELNLTIDEIDTALRGEYEIEQLINEANAELESAARDREAEIIAPEAEARSAKGGKRTKERKSLAQVAPQVSEAKFKELEAKAAKPSEAKPPEEKVRAPELQEKIDQLQGVLNKILAKYGLKDVKVNLEEGMADEGSYSGQLIKLALDLDNPVRTLRHEAIHALKELGFFTPQQWKVLTDRAQKEWIEKYLKGQKAVVDGKEMTRYDAYMKLYDGDMEAIVEESIADAFADFTKAPPPAGMMKAILNRMQNLFKAIKQAMNVGGYDTAEDVFGAVEKGELPAPPVNPTKAEEKSSLRRNVAWTDERINRLLSSYAYTQSGREDDTKAYATRITPQEFLNATTTTDYLKQIKEETKPLDPEKLAKEDQEIYLEIRKEEDGVYQIVNHEGRHRMSALQEAGYTQGVPVVLINRPYEAIKNAEIIEEPYFKPQQFGDKKATKGISAFNMVPISWNNRNALKEEFGGEAKVKFSLRAPKTEEFKNWFGDSKITDDNGEPLVVYHGTKADITAFDTDAEELRGTTTELDILSPMGSHFSKDPQVANNFAKQTGSVVYPVFLRILNPKVYKKEQDLRDELIQQSLNNQDVNDVLENPDAYLNYAEGDLKQDADPEVRYNLYDGDPKYRQIVNQAALNNLRDTADPEVVAGFLKDMAYAWKSANPSVDGVIYKNGAANEVRGAKSPTSYIAFAPNQIKSTTGNYGEYGLESADIRKSLRPLPTLPTDVTDRVKATIVPRYQAGYIEKTLEAISPKQFSKFRKEFINRYDALARFDREAAKQIKLMGGKEQLADAKAESAALFADLGGGLAASAMGVNDRKGGIPVYVKKYVVEKDFLELSTHNTKAAADAAAKKVPGAKVYEQGYTKVMDKAEGLLPIFQQLATYAKPKLGEPDAYSQYQFWADVKRTSKYILNPGTGKYEEKLFTQDDIKRAEKIEKAFPEFVEIQKKWIAYNNGLVDFMRDTGVVSEAGAKEMKKHGDYFPLYRHLGEDDIQGPRLFTSIANVQGPKAAKGSESEVTDFFETIVRNTQSAIQAGIKNVAARRATDQAMRIGEVVKLDRPQSGPTIYRVLEDGKETYYQARDPMFIESLKSLYQPDIPFIGLLSAPARILRNLVTKDPAFQLANMMRDSLSAYVASGFKFTPIVATLKQYAKAIADKSPEMRELRSAGVIGGYDYSQGVETSARKLEAEIRKAAKARTTMEKLTSPATSLWGALEKSSEASDSATRQEIYKKVLEQTGNEAEALYQALEIMNFNRKGRSPIIRILTAAVPFMNARIQGLDVLYRSGMRPISGDATEAEKKRMNTFWVRGMMLMALSSMYWLLTHDDEDYKAQEQETRDNYWLFPSAGVKIPIPFEIGVMFKVIPERILEYAFGSDTGKDFLKSMSRQFMSTFAFNPIPQTFLPAVEVTTNYSFFTQRPIITPGMENISPEYQVGPNTSKVSGAIGQALNISPIKLDYLIQGYTGTMGMYAVNLFDSFFSMNDEASKPSKRLEQMPVLKRFMVDPEARGAISAYYDLKNSVDEVVRTSNFLQRSMDFENYGQYMQENVQMLAVKDYINDLEKTMKEYREMKNLVRISNMDADSKRDTLSNIGKLEQQLTKNIQMLKKQIASQ